MRALRLCATPGCTGVAATGYCTPCFSRGAGKRTHEQQATYDAARGGGRDKWQALRLATFERDRYQCVLCRAFGNASTLRCDHIVPGSAGGSATQSNLRTLCIPCHKSVTPNGGG